MKPNPNNTSGNVDRNRLPATPELKPTDRVRSENPTNSAPGAETDNSIFEKALEVLRREIPPGASDRPAVAGPIALGHSSHFGLGLFVPFVPSTNVQSPIPTP